MYAISLLNKHQQEYILDLARRNLSKGSTTTLALARVISKTIMIPSSPVESVEQYYREQGSGVVDNILESLNQIAPFDYKTAKDLSLHFFRYGYDAVHGDCKAYVSSYDNGLAMFFRLNKHFSPETLCFINEHHKDISYAVSMLSEIVDVLQKGGNDVAQ